MHPHGQRTTFGFGATLTPLGKTMLIIYAVVYVLELVGQHWLTIPVFEWFALSPVTSRFFHFWQLVTHPFVHDPGAPIGFLINCLVFYFFAGTVESALGTRRFLIFYGAAALGGALAGLLFSLSATFNVPYAGMMPSLLALIVAFGLLHPEATILLMFILPIKAKYISYGTLIVTALTFLAKTNPHGAYHLGGIGIAWFYFHTPTHWFDLNWWRWKRFERSQKQKRSKFKVIPGDQDDDDQKPTIH